MAIPKLSLGGLDVIDKVKTELEKTYPGVVCCADIMAWLLEIQFPTK